MSTGHDTLRLGLAGSSTNDFTDPRSWSGLPHSMYKALQRRADVELPLLAPLTPPRRVPEALRKGIYMARREKYFWEREPRILRHYERQLEGRFRAASPDVVLTLGTVASAVMPRDVPQIVYVDCTFALNANYYETWTPMSARSLELGTRTDRLAFGKADHVVAASDWAARGVHEEFGVPYERITVLPMGAQHVCALPVPALARRYQQRLDGPLRLLWMGVEWERKGGDVALAVAQELDRRGVAVQLDLVGDQSPAWARELPFVTEHGFLDRRTQGSLIDELFLSSFALLLPSRAENSSVVLADAASYGLPSIVPDTGGMSTMVHPAVNGELLEDRAAPGRYADVLVSWWDDPQRYLHLCRTSRARFEAELNWDVGVARIADIAQGLHRSDRATARRVA
jgi:glycosyltransferase involved in cell wall biosynthesis